MELIAACRLNNLYKVKLVAHRDNINFQDENGNTPLHICCSNINIEIFKEIMKYGPDINHENNYGNTPLHYICGSTIKGTNLSDHKKYTNDRLKILEDLIKLGADIDKISSYDSTTPLMFAMYTKNYEAFNILLNLGANLYYDISGGLSPLHIACRNSDLDMFHRLIEHGVSINNATSNGNNALHYASSVGCTNIVNKLILLGVDIDICDNENRSALYFACRNREMDTVKYLVDSGANLNNIVENIDNILEKCYKDDINLIEYLTSLNINVKIAKYLYIACKHNNISVVAYLIKLGMDINIANDGGLTALHFGCYSGSLDMIEYLIKNGADINHIDNDGRTMIYHAKKTSIIKYLLSLGLKIDNPDEELSLVLASGIDDEEDWDYLSNMGISINYKDVDGFTYLYTAVYHNSLRQVKLLLKMGADANLTTNNGDTPLHMACQKGNLEIVTELIKYMDENKLDHANNDGITPLYLAVDYDHHKVVEKLIESGAVFADNLIDKYGYYFDI